MWNPLDEVVRRQKAGDPHGITSVCSAHPLVIEAAVRQALASGGTFLAEATSDQVDQYGGYTGMRPEDFRELVHGIATRHGLPLDRVVLGGDRLSANLSALGIPLPLLSAHLPVQYRRVRTGALTATPRDLVVDRIRDVLRDHDRACHTQDKEHL